MSSSNNQGATPSSTSLSSSQQMSDVEPTNTSITEDSPTSITSITSDTTTTIPVSQTESDTESAPSTSPTDSTSISSTNNDDSTATTTDTDTTVVPTSVSNGSNEAETPTQTETQPTTTSTTSSGDSDGEEDQPPTSSTEVPPPTSTSDPTETTVTSESTPTQSGEPPETTGSEDTVTTTQEPPTSTATSEDSTQTEGETSTTVDSPPTNSTTEATTPPTQTEAPPVTTTDDSTSVATPTTVADPTTSETESNVTTTAPPGPDQQTSTTATSESSPTSILENNSGQATAATVSETFTESTSVTSVTFESTSLASTVASLTGASVTDATPTVTRTTPLSIPAFTLSPLRATNATVSMTATQTITSDILTITTLSSLGTPGTLTVIPTDASLSDTVNPSDLNIFTQAPISEPERARLDLSSVPFTIEETIVTTEFATSTLSDGDVTVVPTRTRTSTRTVTGSGSPTYTLQPNAFERNKGAIVGVIVVGALLAGIGIFVGIWLCRRRKRKVDGRRYNPSPIGDVTTGRVLIRGHDGSFPSDRDRRSGSWRPPLVEEVWDEEEGGDIYTRPSRSMSQRSRGTSIRPVTSYRDCDGRRGDVRSITSGGQASANTMHFGTSLLSFDVNGPSHQQFRNYQPAESSNRFSGMSMGSSEEEGGTVRTASLISLSAEPTPLDGQFSRSGSSLQHGEIPIISPFADSFSVDSHASPSFYSPSQGTPRRSVSLGSQNSSNAQSLISLDQDRGWREIEIEDPSDVPRPRGGDASASPAASANPFIYDDEDDDDESPPPSLMSQMARISLMSQQEPQQPTIPASTSTSSLLNPPMRPQFRGRLTDLIQSSHPPVLPPIPFIASPALTDVTEESYMGSYTFHPEGLIDVQNQRSQESLLDHVDYSRPISSMPIAEEGEGEFDSNRIVFSRMSATETEASSLRTGESLSEFEARSTQEDAHDDDGDPFRDPRAQSRADLVNDASPVLMVLERAAASRVSLGLSAPSSSAPSSPSRTGFGTR